MTEATAEVTEETTEELKQEEDESQALVTVPKEQPPMKSGFVIGIGADDNFIFEILGTEPSVVDLLGLLSLASDRIKARVDFQLGGETSTILAKLDSIVNIITGTPAAPGGNKLN